MGGGIFVLGLVCGIAVGYLSVAIGVSIVKNSRQIGETK
jgi:hypothetical protein